MDWARWVAMLSVESILEVKVIAVQAVPPPTIQTPSVVELFSFRADAPSTLKLYFTFTVLFNCIHCFCTPQLLPAGCCSKMLNN